MNGSSSNDCHHKGGMMLYIHSKRSAALANSNPFFLHLKTPKYLVAQVQGGGQVKTVFSSDCRDELKVWLDLMGYSLGKNLFDSLATGKMPVLVHGVYRSYDLKCKEP